jgi:hypothetical protein
MSEHIVKLAATSSEYQRAVESAQQQAVNLFAEKINSSAGGFGEVLSASVKSTQVAISDIETGIRSLNAVLEKLGDEKIVVQQIQKKGWFSRS